MGRIGLDKNTGANIGLLPAGFRDILQPEARLYAGVTAQLLAHFQTYGYDRVIPPLVEYEASLLNGPGVSHTNQLFRLMDTQSPNMMAVRSDITVQMARLALTRLAGAPRPLRLAYAGNVLRVKGSQLRPARQFMQAGVELVGATGVEAEVEVMALAVEALGDVGATDISIDLTFAPLVSALLNRFDANKSMQRHLIAALDAKDADAFKDLPDDIAALGCGFIKAAGPVDTGLATLKDMALGLKCKELVKHAEQIVRLLRCRLPNVQVTIDPCETRGFEYKDGVGFALFCAGIDKEIGRGGHYFIEGGDDQREAATGFSLYVDTIAAIFKDKDGDDRRIFACYGEDRSMVRALREQGRVVIEDIESEKAPFEKAALLGCTEILVDGEVRSV